MKKRMILVFAFLFLLVGLSACTNQEQNKTDDVKQKESEHDVIRVGMELKWPPFETADENGNAEGISVLIAEELGKYLGKDVEIVDLSFSTLITALESEKIDIIIASMGRTDERAKQIDFSEPYMYFKLLTAVNKDSGLKTAEDIFAKEGIRFVAPKSFSSIELVKEKANNPQVIEFDDKATATLELANGNADAFIVDAVTAVAIAKSYPDNIDVVFDPVQSIPICMGIKKGNTELKEKADEFISKLDELGVNKKIEEKYNDILNEMLGKGYEFYINEH